MARKNTLKCTQVIRKPLLPVRTYHIYVPRNSEAIFVTANMVEEMDCTLTFKIMFEGNTKFEEKEEIVAMFKEWDFFIVSDSELSKT